MPQGAHTRTPTDAELVRRAELERLRREAELEAERARLENERLAQPAHEPYTPPPYDPYRDNYAPSYDYSSYGSSGYGNDY